ncbi:solute carrier family 35 member G1 [Hyla sarda]|uniref:solute carrier family 35 member G1 n=1 Tax=Hyla sarda TaxID=327740 RepID=UPI0024C34C2A|nr:solute carrier family 35 member G1 [Hyla sarda]
MGCDDREVSDEEPEIRDLEGQGRIAPPDKNGCPQNPMWDGEKRCEVYADTDDSPFSGGPGGDTSQNRTCCPRLMATDEETGKKKCTCPGLGLCFTVLSALFFSSSNVLVKKIDDMHSVEISAIRCVFQMLFVLPGLIYYKLGFLGPKNQRIFLFLRGLLGSTAMILQYYAVQSMPLADATVITFSSPAFTCIFACIFLKEKCTVWDIVFMLFTITGVVLIARPPFLFGSHDSLDEEYSNHMKGTIAAVASAVGASLTIVVLRKMGKSVHYLLSIWYYAIIGLIECVIALFVIGAWSLPQCGLDRWLLVFIGILGLGGQTFLVKALQIEKAGPVSVMRTMDVVFAFIFQTLFLHRTPSWLTIGGALCIVAGTAGTVIVKWYTGSKEVKKSEL